VHRSTPGTLIATNDRAVETWNNPAISGKCHNFAARDIKTVNQTLADVLLYPEPDCSTPPGTAS
jgi:hypothetical protein